MELIPVRTPLVTRGDDLVSVLMDSLSLAGIAPLREGDVICVTSKVVSVSQGRVVDLTQLAPPVDGWLGALETRFGTHLPLPTELQYAKAFAAHPALAALVLSEAEVVFVGESAQGWGRVYYTRMDGTWIANGGVDLSNTPDGTAVLWPKAPWAWARDFWERLCEATGTTALGVVLTDSRVPHLRRGITGVAIAWAGFEGVQSEIGEPDLYRRPLRVTERAMADDLAAAAVLMSGEADERTPVTLARGAPVRFTDRPMSRQEVSVAPDDDLYTGIYSAAFRRIRDAGHSTR